MYMYNIKVFAKKWIKTEDSNTNNLDMQSGYWKRIWMDSLFNGISTFVDYLIPKPFS